MIRRVFLALGALSFFTGSARKVDEIFKKENFKDLTDFEMLIGSTDKIDTRLLIVLVDMKNYCDSEKQEFIITDLISSIAEDDLLHRVSTTHPEGRAADLRIRNWDDGFRKKFLNKYNNESDLKHFGAITNSGKTLVVDESNRSHFHVQVSKVK